MNALLPQVERLDIHNGTAVREYEEGFYRAFVPFSNPGIRSIWIWDDEAKRLRTRVPYEDQEIFYLRDREGKINTAGAVNRAGRQFQSAAYGFEQPAAEPPWLEILAAFNNKGQNGQAILAVFEKAYQVLAPQGFAFVYATCPEYSLKWNLRRGWEVIERGDRDSVVRYFLRMKVSESFIPG